MRGVRSCRSRLLSGLRRGVRRLLGHRVDQLHELFQTGGWDDDGVAPAADVLGDPEEAATWIFLEGEHERLPFDLKLFRADGVFVDRGARSRAAGKPARRRTV